MWKYLLLGSCATAMLCAQVGPSQIEFANLREDVRGLNQRVGELQLRVEQLERENHDLQSQASTANRGYATLAQVSQAIDELGRSLRAEMASEKTDTLQRVAGQIEKLGKQTNAALDSLARSQATHATVQTSFSEDYAKEGSSYTVQKGDTLALIAKKTGARLQDIVNANKITDPSHIVVGQTLFIPNAPK